MQESIDMAELLGDLDFDPAALKAKYLEERDKRLRDDGNEQYVEVTAEFSHYVDDPYVEPGFSRAPLHDEVEVAIIGGGFGGLLMAARLREAGFDDIRMIEKAGDFGGTWYWNRYPGAMCDVESYCYLPLLEELDYMPKHKYSFAPEILQHSKRIARHYNLYENACLQTAITQLSWDAKDNRWIIETDRNDRMRARYVAMANGPLSRPKLPGIQGINDYKGHTFHTSRWDYNYTGGNSFGNLSGLKDKRVGIIGTGATAVQCIPHLGEWAKQLYVFQRTPSSIDERNNHDTDQAWAKSLEHGWQQKRMDNFNVLVSGGDQPEDLVADGWTDIMRNLTGIAAKLASRKLGRRLTKGERAELMELADYKKMNAVRARAQKIVNDEKTAELLQPWYRQFCKRPCFHDTYLPTFNRPNVTLVDTEGKGVTAITATSVIANGEEYPVDCIIFATGFEVGTGFSRRAGYDVEGKDGVMLSQKWSDGIQTLHGLHSHGFPNLLIMSNAQSAFTTNFPHAMDENARHMAYLLDTCRDRSIKQFEADLDAEQAWVQEIIGLSRFSEAFQSECTPGYYNNEGQPNPLSKQNASYGKGPIAFFDRMRAWREQGELAGLNYR